MQLAYDYMHASEERQRQQTQQLLPPLSENPVSPPPPRRQSLRNPKFTQALLDTIKEAGVAGGCPKAQGNLIYTVASKHPANALVHRPLLLTYVIDERIKVRARAGGLGGRGVLEGSVGIGTV